MILYRQNRSTKDNNIRKITFFLSTHVWRIYPFHQLIAIFLLMFVKGVKRRIRLSYGDAEGNSWKTDKSSSNSRRMIISEWMPRVRCLCQYGLDKAVWIKCTTESVTVFSFARKSVSIKWAFGTFNYLSAQII